MSEDEDVLPAPRALRRMRAELLHAGGSFLVGGVCSLGFLLTFGPSTDGFAYGALLGGLLGLGHTIWQPGNPARVGYRFGGLPSRLSPYEEQLRRQLLARRDLRIATLANVPYFISVLGAMEPRHVVLDSRSMGEFFILVFFSWVGVFGFSWGVQWLQVFWSLRHEGRQ